MQDSRCTLQCNITWQCQVGNKPLLEFCFVWFKFQEKYFSIVVYSTKTSQIEKRVEIFRHRTLQTHQVAPMERNLFGYFAKLDLWTLWFVCSFHSFRSGISFVSGDFSSRFFFILNSIIHLPFEVCSVISIWSLSKRALSIRLSERF